SPEHIDVIELGPGRGLFAADVLDWAAKQFPAFARALRYVLVEQSEHLRARLRERLAEHLTAGRARIFGSLQGVGSDDGPFILFANEFFDALPVDIVDYRGSLRVGEEQGRFVEHFVPPSADELEYIDRYSVHPEPGERVEVSRPALSWIDRIAQL